MDANLYHDIMTGQLVTAIMNFCNQVPIKWHTRKQETVKTKTYDSEFVEAKPCIERTIDLCITL